MKWTRIAILLIVAAGGCRFAVSQKDVAARRLTEILLTRLVALQSAEPDAGRAASPRIGVPVLSLQNVSARAARQPAAQAWTASSQPASAPCPYSANASRTRLVRTVSAKPRPAEQASMEWLRVVLPVAQPCERAKLSGS